MPTYDAKTRIPQLNWNPFDDEEGEVKARLEKDDVLYFGWIPPELRTPAQKSTNTRVSAAMPDFRIAGSFADDKRKVALYEARAKVHGSVESIPYVWQTTGSCVGAGGGNGVMCLGAVEIVQNGESEEWKAPWWLYTYGESRQIAGMRGRGSGSFGSAWAKAVSTKGTFSADEAGLPKFQMKSGWYYLPSSTELQWSDGQVDPSKWDEAAAKHLVKTVAKVRSADEIAAAIKNGYPCTIASMFGTRGVKVRGSGENAVAIAKWDGSWAHQMSIDGWWDHPEFGELFHDQNQWGPNAHGKPVDGSPLGGFWIEKATMDRIAKDDCWALSQYDGFPAQDLDWNPFDD